jgi:hypothetical protein
MALRTARSQFVYQAIPDGYVAFFEYADSRHPLGAPAPKTGRY